MVKAFFNCNKNKIPFMKKYFLIPLLFICNILLIKPALADFDVDQEQLQKAESQSTSIDISAADESRDLIELQQKAKKAKKTAPVVAEKPAAAEKNDSDVDPKAQDANVSDQNQDANQKSTVAPQADQEPQSTENTVVKSTNQNLNEAELPSNSYMSITPTVTPETAEKVIKTPITPDVIKEKPVPPVKLEAAKVKEQPVPLSTEAKNVTPKTTEMPKTPSPELLSNINEEALNPESEAKNVTSDKENLATKDYLIEIQVADYTSAERTKAIASGLQNLLLKLSGETDIKTLYTKLPNLQKQIKDPSIFVRSYTYVSHSPLDKIAPITSSIIPKTSQLEAAGPKISFLQIQFDPAGVAQILPKGAIHLKPATVENSNAVVKPIQPVAKDGNVISLRVTNVKSLDEYYAVVKYLLTLPQVTKIDLQNLNPENVEVNVTCAGGIKILLQDLKAATQHKLVYEAPLGEANVVDLTYRWNP